MHFHHPQHNPLLPSRLIFQSEAAPKGNNNAPESLKGPEQSREKIMVSEVASQTPSQIMSGAIGQGSAVKTKYQQNTQALANLMPVGDNSSGGASSDDGQNPANQQNQNTPISEQNATKEN